MRVELCIELKVETRHPEIAHYRDGCGAREPYVLAVDHCSTVTIKDEANNRRRCRYRAGHEQWNPDCPVRSHAQQSEFWELFGSCDTERLVDRPSG